MATGANICMENHIESFLMTLDLIAMLQHLKSDRKVICDQRLPQFVVAEGHSI